MKPTWFQRFLLPGLAFKAVVIGGGYATGRELAEFFMPSGPQGGLMGMLLAMAIWSLVCAATFLFAYATASFDYRSFFRALLGPLWWLFEASYLLFMVLILAVLGAAAGAIASAVLGWPQILGALCLMAGIVLFTAFGNRSVERLFKWASCFLYGVYALFVVFAFSSFGDRIAQNLSISHPTNGWALSGMTYAGYNIVCAVVILPVARYFLRPRDALLAGLVAGPMAMLPALLFFLCMIAWYPEIGGQVLPSDFMLQRLDRPIFHIVFQAMIFSALLETGTGAVHALNERVSVAWRARSGRTLSSTGRLAIATALLVGSIFVAERFGLITLIARGYRALAWVLFIVYVLPLLTIGVWRLRRGTQPVAIELPQRNAVRRTS
jgi:uncharacterized membrane protein YkvI